MNAQTLSIYLHIPFCQTMCSYCAFNTYTGMESLIPAFVTALATEIEYVGSTAPDIPVHTIFFGGGTPSQLSTTQYHTLMATLIKSFNIAPDAEISLESNPNDLTPAYLQGLKEVGFNRISMGMQTANTHELNILNREHSMQHVTEAVANAQRIGFDNISLDLMFGLPDQTLASWRDTLDQVIAMNIQNISAYNLILEGNTPLKDDVDAGTLPTPDDDLAADMYDMLTEKLTAAGFAQYEISNWALSGYESRHNIQYWHNAPYLGLGPGAHGFANGIRYIVTRYPQKYIDSLQNPETHSCLPFPQTPAVSKATSVDRAEEMKETIMMGMRLTKEGIERQKFLERFGEDIVTLKQDAIDKHLDYGLLEVTPERLRLTSAGRLLSNAVIRDLI